MRSNLGFNLINAARMSHQSSQQTMLFNNLYRNFSVKTRKLAAKKLASRRVKKYKLKTKKSLQKRMRVVSVVDVFVVIYNFIFQVGTLRTRAFKYFAVGHRHLQRNKSRSCLIRHRTKRHLLTTMGDIKRAKKQLPYFRRSKFLRS